MEVLSRRVIRKDTGPSSGGKTGRSLVGVTGAAVSSTALFKGRILSGKTRRGSVTGFFCV